MISFQEGRKGKTMMYNLIAIEALQRDREREIREMVRRGRLLAGDGTDPELELVRSNARATRRDLRNYPARLATP
jgi:hypothetical protein